MGEHLITENAIYLWISAKCPKVHFPSGNSSYWINLAQKYAVHLKLYKISKIKTLKPFEHSQHKQMQSPKICNEQLQSKRQTDVHSEILAHTQTT